MIVTIIILLFFWKSAVCVKFETDSWSIVTNKVRWMQKLAWNSHDVLVFEWIFFLLQAKKVFLCHILWWWIFFCFWSLHDRTVSKFDDLVSFRPPCYQQHTIVFSENKFVSFCREHWNSTLLITLTHMLLKRLVQVWSLVQFFTVCKWLVCEFSVIKGATIMSVRKFNSSQNRKFKNS